jgi:hypothetical protein
MRGSGGGATEMENGECAAKERSTEGQGVSGADKE